MKNEEEFGKKLTEEEIEIELDKVRDFFAQIPENWKAYAAERFIYEIVNWGSYDHYQALGIFQEAMNTYREVSRRVLAEEAEEERLENAFETAQDYRCLQEVDWLDPPILVGEVYKIGYFGEDDQYGGGKRYEVFHENRGHVNICQNVLDEHFELVNDVD